MTRKGKIIVITAGVAITAGILLFVFGQDKKRKEAFKRNVPPEYAKRMIKNITGQ